MVSFKCTDFKYFLCLKTCSDQNFAPMATCRTVEKGGRGGKRSRARAPKGPVNILCQKILLLLYISAVHFYDISSALKGYLQELSTLMRVLTSETKPNRIDISNLSKLVLSQRVSRWCRRVIEFPFTFYLFGL